MIRPGVPHGDLLLHPVGRAAWVGLFATALNLLPGGQLDGGHILYSVASKYHKKITLVVALLLIPLGVFFWKGWILWAVLLLAIGFRHPPLLNRWENLDRSRLVWAAIAAADLHPLFHANAGDASGQLIRLAHASYLRVRCQRGSPTD